MKEFKCERGEVWLEACLVRSLDSFSYIGETFTRSLLSPMGSKTNHGQYKEELLVTSFGYLGSLKSNNG